MSAVIYSKGGGVCVCVDTSVVRDGGNMPNDISSFPSSHLTWGDRCGELTHFGGEEMFSYSTDTRVLT